MSLATAAVAPQTAQTVRFKRHTTYHAHLTFLSYNMPYLCGTRTEQYT